MASSSGSLEASTIRALRPASSSRASERGGQALLPDVLQRTAEHTDIAGAAGGERARDGICLIAEAFGRLADPLLGFRRDLQPAQGVGNRRRGEPGLVGDVAQGRTPAAFGHPVSVVRIDGAGANLTNPQ